MTDAELLSLAQSNPHEFKRIFAEREEARKSKRREAYARTPDKFKAQAARWRDAHRERERERARKNAARAKALRDAYRQLTQEAA